MEEISQKAWVMQGAMFFGGAMLLVFFAWLSTQTSGKKKIARRIARIQQHKKIKQRTIADDEQQSLRRRKADNSLPTISRILQKLPNLEQFQARLERAGFTMSAERYVALCAGTILFCILVMTLVLRKKVMIGLLLGLVIGLVIPHLIVSMAAGKRVKKFILLLPDAIDLIVRGLRSGLPVTESIQMVAQEVEDPLGSVFGGMAESIRFGVPVEKTLQDTARKVGSTEFNFFVISIILQRETGGNLSEILNNLSEVLRKRVMMRLKIKALSSEAKASAIIVGALPFVVVTILAFIQPDYLTPLIDDTRGNIAALGALCSLGMGVGIMMKMARFEI